jgi:hypothetical protein
MKNKRRLRSGLRKNDLQEAFILTLQQKRHDAAGNRIQGHTFDQILAMTPAERERLKQVGWLGNKTEGKHGRR